MKLLMEYETVTQKVLFGDDLIASLMFGRKYDVITQNGFSSMEGMCLLGFFETKSVIKMKRRYRRDLPSDNVIRRWIKQFQETDNVLHRKRATTLRNSQEDVHRIQEGFSRSRQKCTRLASLQIAVPQTIVWSVVHSRLHLNAYKVHIMH
jgi:hypothetical protein